MSKIEYQVYIIGMIESLINHNEQTDLGNYILEYMTDFAEIGGGDMYNGDACLAVAVRLKNKSTDLFDWGKIYYKRLIPNSSAVSADAREKLEEMLSDIRVKSVEEKLDFILRSESKIFKRPYAKSSLVYPQLASFFENLNHMDSFDYPAVALGGKFPKDAIPYLDDVYTDIVAKVPSLSEKREKKP